MVIAKKDAGLALRVADAKRKEQGITFDTKMLENYKNELKQMAKLRKYTDKDAVTKDDFKVIKENIRNMLDEVAGRFTRKFDAQKENVDLEKYSLTALDYLVAVTVNELNCPQIDLDDYKQLDGPVDNMVRTMNDSMPYKAPTIQDCFESTRGIDAHDLRNDLYNLMHAAENRSSGAFSVDETAQLFVNYRALQQRQANHGRIWRFFHPWENDARNQLLADMKEKLSTRLGDSFIENAKDAVDVVRELKGDSIARSARMSVVQRNILAEKAMGYDRYRNDPDFADPENLLSSQLEKDLSPDKVATVSKVSKPPVKENPKLIIN